MTVSYYHDWLRCHGCGTEYSMADGARNKGGCGNLKCFHSDIHIHSDRDGERPTDEYVRIMSVRMPPLDRDRAQV